MNNDAKKLYDGNHWRLAVGLLLAALIIPSLAPAQDWRIEPVFRGGLEWDDNATLDVRTDDEVDLQGYLLEAKAEISYESPVTDFFIEPRALVRKYSDEPDFDTDEYFLRSRYTREMQSNTLGFRLHYDNQSVRNAERSDVDLDIDDPDALSNDDSGRILVFGTRSKWRFSPSWQYQLSSVSSIGARVDYFDVSYSDVFAGALNDYTDARLSLDYVKSISDVSRFRLTATGRQYQREDVDTDIRGAGLLVGFDHVLTEKTSIRAMIGMENAESDLVSSDPEVVGYVRLTQNLETIRMFAQYRRSINGTGAGRLSVRDSLNVNFRRRLNDRISAGLGVRAYRSRGATNQIAVDNRNYAQIQATFQWYLSTAFVLEADYRYTFLDRTGLLQESSNSNQVGLWIIYQPNSVPDI